uniref:Coiled-coil domain containing 146 n=1 Tax=Amphiprion percula TaxID=161767 RepID=A0A3P8TLV6_AMPPE
SMKISNSSTMRDKLHNDISKISQEFEDNKLELMRLAQMINLQEETLLETNKNHETATQRRNFLGIQLLEHEEVLFNYHEKINIQEAAIAKTNMALETVEKDMKDLELTIKEEKRQIDLKKKEVLLKRKLEGEIVMLQIEVEKMFQARDQTLEGLNRTVDYKELKGSDPSTAELVKKIEQLEVNLAERERQLLEKELLVDQVTRLSKPLGEQAENCRQDRLTLAKKLNELRTNIINTNHRMMAVSAELSMKQAVALSQQQQMKEKELQVRGVLPALNIIPASAVCLCLCVQLAEEEEWKQLPSGQYTTAEARPNAYIPQNDPLQVAKPYGAQAPFKPSQPGANMRHIRKPTLKPLEM